MVKKPQMPSPSAQRIYLAGVARRVFSIRDAKAVAGNAQTARKAVVQLVKRGFIIRVHRGVYMAVPPEFLETGYDVDRYILAQRIAGNDGAMAYHTALEIHGVAHSAFNVVFALSRKRIRPFGFQGVDYRFVHAPQRFGVQEISRDIVKVRVTDKERTIIDCIRRPDLCGGLEEVIKSIGTFRLVNTARLGDYLARYGEKGLVQRTGFILSVLGGRLRVSSDFLSSMRHSVSSRPYYLAPRQKRGSGMLNKEWNVIVPKNLEEVMRAV